MNYGSKEYLEAVEDAKFLAKGPCMSLNIRVANALLAAHAECERLKAPVCNCDYKLCPECGTDTLSARGMDLIRENQQLRTRIKELEALIEAAERFFYSGPTRKELLEMDSAHRRAPNDLGKALDALKASEKQLYQNNILCKNEHTQDF
jgi:hypothetical protein